MDLQTLFVMTLLVDVVLSLMMVFYWKTQRIYNGFGYWTASYVVAAVYFGLFAYRYALPDWVDMGVGNLLVMSVVILRYKGICRYFGIAMAPDARRAERIVLPLVAALVVWQTIVFSLPVGRALAVTAVLCFYAGLIVWQTIRAGAGIVALVIGLLHLVYIVSLLLRFVTWFFDEHAHRFLAVTQWNQVFFSVGILLDISIAIAFLIMNSQRLMAELVAAQNSLSLLSQSDPLTGSYNRRGLTELAEKEVARAKRFHHDLTLIIFDVDHFKLVNDTFGHAAGDAVLVHVVQEARRCVRENDIVGRLGGDEFVIMLPELPIDKARGVAARLRYQLEHEPFTWDGKPLEVYLSVGVAGLRSGDADFEMLLHRADLHLYEAKRLGRNQIVTDIL